MKRTVANLAMAVVLLVFFLPSGTAQAATPELFIREIKITGDEFIVLQAVNNIPDLSAYWLGYSSSDSAANIVPVEQLPKLSLNSGQALLLTSDQAPICDAVYTDGLSFSLADSAGAVELRRLDNSGSISSLVTIDRVNWFKPTSKTPYSGQSLNMVNESGLTTPVWYQNMGASPVWQAGDFANCTLGLPGGSAIVSWPAGPLPPVKIISIGNSSSTAGRPAADVGLASPQITELLANPASPQTDADDEFIELYNPNDSTFDLSGFTLEIGLTTKHDYTFEAGMNLPAKSFKAFYSSDTRLSLSNSGSQVWLLDPAGNIMNQTDAYGSTKEGQAWALANGVWYWTSTPTPGAANIINGVVASSLSKTKTTPQVAGASTNSAASQSSGVLNSSDAAATPVHPLILVAVGAAALLYGGYEYRADLANNIYRLRRYYQTRRAGRPKSKGRGSYRTALRSWRRQNYLRPRSGQRRKK